jgi:hypothetical protein
MSAKSFSTLFERLGRRAGMPFTIFPHMLRHALRLCPGQCRARHAWLGHKNIQHAVRYTELAPDRFKDFWRQIEAADSRRDAASKSKAPVPFAVKNTRPGRAEPIVDRQFCVKPRLFVRSAPKCRSVLCLISSTAGTRLRRPR